jgi:hypothetical protein
MASAWVEALASPALSAAIGALAGIGGGWITTHAQRRERQEIARQRRQEEAAKAVGPMLSLMLEGRFDHNLGFGDLSGRLGAWEAAWSTSREPLFIMSAGHPSESVQKLGESAATDVRHWLEAVRLYVIKAQELSERRRVATYQKVRDETSDPDEATRQANEAAVVHPNDQELNPQRNAVEEARQEARKTLHDLLIALRRET